MDELLELVGGPGGGEPIVAALRAAPCLWWVAGGQALRLYVGRSWRHHDDLDLGLRRAELALFVEHLRQSGMTGLPGRPSTDGAIVDHTGPVTVEVVVSEGDDECWVYRHDRRIRVDWRAAVLATAAGIPYLAPELLLLTKSRALREKDDGDARIVMPELDAARRAWLGRALPRAHPWQGIIDNVPR